jgi:hypothetical protein
MAKPSEIAEAALFLLAAQSVSERASTPAISATSTATSSTRFA